MAYKGQKVQKVMVQPIVSFFAVAVSLFLEFGRVELVVARTEQHVLHRNFTQITE